MKTETAEVRSPKLNEGTKPGEGKRPRFGVAAVVAVLLLALLAYGSWAQDPATGMTASETDRAAQPAEEGYPPQGANPPAARPHPRGLPRHATRDRLDRGRSSGRGSRRRETA